jgi:hypothetical protein
MRQPALPHAVTSRSSKSRVVIFPMAKPTGNQFAPREWKKNHGRQKEHAYELIDRLPPTQLSAVVSVLEAMLDPLARSLANAPMEDELISEEETHAVSASKAWLKNHEPIPHQDVLAELGLTSEDFGRMGRTPLDPHRNGQ